MKAMRFNRQGTGTAWDVSPRDVDRFGVVSRPARRPPPHYAAVGRQVSRVVFSQHAQPLLGRPRQPCRPLPPRTECSEGMPWALLVLGWVLHQMPRHGERCSSAFRSVGLAVAVGGWRLPVTSTRRETPTPARPLRRASTSDHAYGRQPDAAKRGDGRKDNNRLGRSGQPAIANKTRQRETHRQPMLPSPRPGKDPS